MDIPETTMTLRLSLTNILTLDISLNGNILEVILFTTAFPIIVDFHPNQTVSHTTYGTYEKVPAAYAGITPLESVCVSI